MKLKSKKTKLVYKNYVVSYAIAAQQKWGVSHFGDTTILNKLVKYGRYDYSNQITPKYLGQT